MLVENKKFVREIQLSQLNLEFQSADVKSKKNQIYLILSAKISIYIFLKTIIFSNLMAMKKNFLGRSQTPVRNEVPHDFSSNLNIIYYGYFDLEMDIYIFS